MKSKDFQRIKRIIIVFLMIIVGFSIYINNTFFLLMSLTLMMIFLSFLKLKVKDALEDERQVALAEKAARTSFLVLMPVLGLTSLALFVGGGNENFYYVKALGIILSYITCLGLIIYVISYWYFNKKFGG